MIVTSGNNHVRMFFDYIFNGAGHVAIQGMLDVLDVAKKATAIG